MTAGAEDQAGIQIDRGTPVGHGLAPLPLGNDIKLFAHRERLVILLPVVGPVLLLERESRYLQAAAVRLRAGAECAQTGLQLLQPGMAVLVIGQVALHPVRPGARLLQRLVHLVPAALVLVGKLLKVRLLLDHQPAYAQRSQVGAHRLYARGGGVNAHFQPDLFHKALLFHA